MFLKIFDINNFLGRKNELEILQGIASQAKTGIASNFFLSGRRGIGKTDLLRYLHNHFFNDQNNAIPFFYTFKTAFTSIENFSKDYLGSFILQSLAFLKKDSTIVNSGIYSLEDLTQLAKDSDVHWAVNIIDNYLRIESGSAPMRRFLFAILAPYRSYLSTGMPVVVMIDDFHKIKKFCKLNTEDHNKNFWIYYENSFQSLHTPHIFTGAQSELKKMFFEETSFGEHLELLNLEGLNRSDTIKLFTVYSEMYGLNVEAELFGFIDTFNGNPFYIKSFLQAARQVARSLSGDDFWEIYFNEITRGKTYTYWTSLLKTHISQFDLRKPSLNFLYYLSKNSHDIDFSNITELLSVKREECDRIISLLNVSGAVEEGFSLLEIANDQVLIDVIKGLYHKEILRESLSKTKEVMIIDKRQRAKKAETPSFNITIPAVEKAELVAIKSLEQIAQHFNIPLEITGQLQVALVELFANVLARNSSLVESYDLKFKLIENTFSMEITTSQEDFTITDTDRSQARAYIDDIKIEKIIKGTRITLLKEISKDLASAS